MKRIKKISRMSLIILAVCSVILSTVGCGNSTLNKSLAVKTFKVSDEKVKGVSKLQHTDLTDIYSGIEDMYADAEYVVAGTIKDIQYFQVDWLLLRKIDVLITKSYKGTLEKDMIISVLENDGYLRLKSMYEDLQKKYRESGGDKDKEEQFLYTATLMSTKEDIENDKLIRYTFYDKEDSNVGDELLLFLTDTSEDTYKDKKVQLARNEKLSYPEGAYTPLGLFMGKFTLEGDTYTRYPYYFTAKSAVDLDHIEEKVPEAYTVQEMEQTLNSLMEP